jgi:hypothetical protein
VGSTDVAVARAECAQMSSPIGERARGTEAVAELLDEQTAYAVEDFILAAHMSVHRHALHSERVAEASNRQLIEPLGVDQFKRRGNDSFRRERLAMDVWPP